MDHPIAHHSSSTLPDFSAYEARQRLEHRITELAAHIAAATYELLVLIGRYDEGARGAGLARLATDLGGVP